MKQFLFIVFLLTFPVLGQEKPLREVEGRIVIGNTKEPLAFSKVFNLTTQKGTISNADGFFRITVKGPVDSLTISCIGFRTQTITVQPESPFLNIELEENYLEFAEVDARPNDHTWLFELVDKCVKNASPTGKAARGYYFLKSFADEQQLELVEGFYNVSLSAYDIRSMDLKAGRFGLVPFGNRYFVSQESSKAITSSRLSDPNDYFPDTPIELKKKAARKAFFISLEAAYKDESADSIYVLHYTPKDTSGNSFEGKIWLNVTDMTLRKLSMRCDHCLKHPFLPLFKGADSIENVSLSITKTFTDETGRVALNHIDFSYDVDYISRFQKQERMNYTIHANALLYIYDYNKPFELPVFQFQPDVSDYRKIDAMPYNAFFWERNDEYSLSDERKDNARFYNDPKTKRVFIFELPDKKTAHYESPFVHWSHNRVFIRESENEHAPSRQGEIMSNNYELDVKIFMDINTYGDSTNVLTETVMDPYGTFYALPMDKYTNCFINMYFDLCEMGRRKMEAAFRQSSGSADEYRSLYREYTEQLEKRKTLFLREVERGTQRKAMEKWNAEIMNDLGIDNISLFQLYTEEENK